MTEQTKVLTLFDEYRVALLNWNEAIRNKHLDSGRVKLTSITHDKKELALELLQDEILKQANVDRCWKRKNEDLFD